jgi:hypothetical protein
MFNVKFKGQEGLLYRLRGIANADLTPLLKDVAKAIEADNRRGLLAGEDASGAPLAPVTPYRGRPGTGPPLAPQGASSRVIADFRTRIAGGKRAARVEGYWDLPWLVYHIDKRNIIGLRPPGLRAVMGLVKEWMARTVRRP